MPRKLSDQDVAEIRDRAVAGESAADLAAAFDVSRQHVSRLVRGVQRPDLEAPSGDGAVTTALRELLDGLDLDAGGRVIAATALALARKLDAAVASDAAAAGSAAPQLARQMLDAVSVLPNEDRVGAALAALRDARAVR